MLPRPLPARYDWQAILSTGCLRAPKPLAHGELPLGGSFLLMEHLPFIPFGQSIPEVLKHLAEGLAEMHLRDPPPGVQGGGRQENVLETLLRLMLVWWLAVFVRGVYRATVTASRERPQKIHRGHVMLT